MSEKEKKDGAFGKALSKLPIRKREAMAFAGVAAGAVVLGLGISLMGRPAANGPKPGPSVTVVAEGYQAKTSTPAVAHVEGRASDGEEVDTYRAVEPGTGEPQDLGVPAGEYEVSWISPINEDGSVYDVPSPAPVEDGAEVEFDRVPAKKVTKKRLDKIVGELEVAVRKGDETIAGKTGEDIIDRAEDNAQNAPAATDGKKPSSGKDKDKEGSSKPDKKDDKDKKPSGGSSSSKPSGGSSSKPSKPSGGSSSKPSKPSGDSSSSKPSGGSSSSKPSGGSSSKPSKPSGGSSSKPSKPAQPQKPVHKHSWQPVYGSKQVWVPKIEYIRHTRYTCNGCGGEWSGDHAEAYAKKGDLSHGTYVDDSWTEKVDRGHYETQSYVSHYACSCGATR